MMMTWRTPEYKHETLEGEGILQQEEVWMTIEQDEAIAHPFILRKFFTIQHLIASFWMEDPRSSILVSSVTLTCGSSLNS